MDEYTEAHLFVAAIRICEQKSGASPIIEDICELLGFSVEHGHTICRKLKKKGIVNIYEDPFSFKVSVADHLAIELLPKEEKAEDSFAKEIEAFKAKKKDMNQEVANIQAELDRKKKEKFAEIEARLKGEIDRQM